MEEQPTELVERKGVGHPGSICDAIMDAVSFERSGRRGGCCGTPSENPRM